MDNQIRSNLESLSKLPCWMGFKHLKTHGSKIPSKPPCDWMGRVQKATDFEYHAPFKELVKPFERGLIDGFTFVMLGRKFMIIDCDDYVIDGKLSEFAKGIVDYFDSYTELSISKTGIHIIIELEEKSIKSDKKFRNLDIELLGNWCVITGDCITNPNKIAVISPEKFDRAVKRLEHLNGIKPKVPSKYSIYASDEVVLKKMFDCQHGAKLKSIFDGICDDDESHNFDRLDYTLARNLLYWTNNNVHQTIRLMWASGLVREKWNRDTNYVERTVNNANK